MNVTKSTNAFYEKERQYLDQIDALKKELDLEKEKNKKLAQINDDQWQIITGIRKALEYGCKHQL